MNTDLENHITRLQALMLQKRITKPTVLVSYLELTFEPDKGKVSPIHIMKVQRRSSGISPFIVNLATGWR